MGRRKPHQKTKEEEIASDLETTNEELKAESVEEKVELIKTSKKPNFTPQNVELKDEEKNINPPPVNQGKSIGLTESWGPANRKRR